MSRVQVLVTTMHQSDFSKYSQMNLQTDAVIANQTNKDSVETAEIYRHSVILVSTKTRGTSRNRNIAMACSNQKSEIIMFADDDLVFNDGYEKEILEEFDRHPEAQAIKFNLHDLSGSRKITMGRIQKFERATRRNMSSSGVWGVAIKRTTLERFNLKFREDFGPGTVDYKGEDSIFLMEMINKGVAFYRSPIDIAGIDQTSSSWFNGYDAKFYTVSGKVFAAIFPKLCYIISIRSALRSYKRGNNEQMSFLQILRCYFDGITSYKSGGGVIWNCNYRCSSFCTAYAEVAA